ncbi:MAG TPA: GIY-YIG nuclease family protein, partial [Rhabdochlamydiaceae bacterium]
PKRAPLQPKDTPDKYYPLRKDGKLAVTPTAAKTSRVIYVILNKETGERYVGKTEQELRERLYSHNFGIAHPEKEAGQKRLYEDIREKPENFEIGILRKVDDKENIIDAEKELIEAKGSYDNGYNLTRGGGSQKTGSGTADLPDEVPTPKKYYAFDEAELKFQFSPAVAKTKNVIYVIFDQQTGRRYVGKTEQALRQRFNGHHFNIAHPKTEDGAAELYQAIRERPEDFFAGILYQPLGEEDDLEVLEAYLIEQKGAYEEGYNRMPGIPLTYEDE